MASVFSENLRIFNAEQFKESVSEESNTKIYFSIGKTFAWANEANPDQANTSLVAFNDIWRKMIAAKRLYGNDIRHVIPRFNWTTDTEYTAYDDTDTTIFDGNTAFYVVTEDWNVYKCLANNNGGLSNTKPQSISTTNAFQTADGYIWKYMYTVTAEEQLRFTTDAYIPVKTLSLNDGSLQWLVQNNATSGALTVMRVTAGGDGYANGAFITIDGDGSEANAYPVFTANVLTSVVVDDPGAGYTYATATVWPVSDGAGATVKPIIEPYGGHGSDPVRELNGNRIMINPRLRGTEGDKIPITNDIRQVALIQDPLIYGTTTVASNSVMSQFVTLTMTGGAGDYVLDETVYQGGSVAAASFKGEVLEWDEANSQIKLTNVFGTVSSDLLTGANSTAARFVSSATNPDFEPFTGKLLYTDNIQSIARAADQTEDFKIVLKF